MLITDFIRLLGEKYTGEADIHGVRRSYSIEAVDESGAPCELTCGKARTIWLAASYSLGDERLYAVLTGFDTDGAAVEKSVFEESLTEFENEIRTVEAAARSAESAEEYFRALAKDGSEEAEKSLAEMEKSLNKTLKIALFSSLGALALLIAVILIAIFR